MAIIACGAALAISALPGSPTGSSVLLYPGTRTVHSRPVRIIAVAPLGAQAPKALLDGKLLPLRAMQVDPNWLSPGVLRGTSAKVGDRSKCSVWAAVAPVSMRPTRLKIDAAAIGWDWSRKTGEAWTQVGDGSWRRADGVAWSRASGEAWERTGDGGWAPVSAGSDWRRASDHPLLAAAEGEPDCQVCHGGNKGVLSAAATPRACSPCHPEASVQLIHRHVAEPLARCAMCHDPHGAPFPKLLLAPRDKLCSQCHALGHSKG